MSQNKLMYIRVLDGHGAILYEGHASRLPFPQETIMRKCYEFYGDPEPCAVRREAVITRMAAEIQHALAAGPLHPAMAPFNEYFAAFPDARIVAPFYP